MISLQALVPTLAAVSSLTLAALALVGRPRQRIQWIFALGMTGFAVESLLILMLLSVGGDNGDSVFWLTALQITRIANLLAWGVFVAALADLQKPRLSRAWRAGWALGVGLAAASAAAVAIWPSFAVVPGGWQLVGVSLMPAARVASIVEILLTVGILAGLEACLRTSRGENRRRVKYLVLGLGGVFLVRFYLLSQILLFQTVAPIYVKTMSATLFLGTLLLAFPIARDQLRGAELSVSRQIVYRSAVVAVLGVYLFIIGVAGSLINYLAVPEEMFWGSVLVFASAVGLTALLLSDDLRWRVKRFIGVNFYRSKYDYREQWVAFTTRMSSLLGAEEIGRELVDAVSEATGAASAAIYLSEPGDAKFRFRGGVGKAAFVPLIDGESEIVSWLRENQSPTAVPGPLRGTLTTSPLPEAIVVGLRWRTALIGFIVLGPERSGRDYNPEDFEFLSTVAAQAAGSIMTTRLSESVAQARELEAFDRVTAAVIHDIKNSVSALSLLARNSERNFDDPEFQRDSIATVWRTVDRMRRLLGKLTSPTSGASSLPSEPVDLGALIVDATKPLATDGRIRLVRQLNRVADVEGDREALLRVVENLVTNAVEAIDGEGTVTVTLSEERGHAVIQVADTGCGISDEYVRRFLFSPFRSTKKGGWGIGLYHTKQVVERHCGEISVESVEGEGTSFTVKLPLPVKAAAMPSLETAS